MKANNGKGNCVERDEWETPQWLFDKLDEQYNFSYDCCASEKNKKAPIHPYDFLDEVDRNICTAWMNPPFSKADVMFKQFFKVIDKGVAIYRCDNMETKVWQDIILKKASWIFIPNKRIAYEGMDGKGSRFPSALIGFHVEKIRGLGGITLSSSPLRSSENEMSVNRLHSEPSLRNGSPLRPNPPTEDFG